MATIGLILAILFFILGLVGTLLPVLPGAPLLWLGMLVYGLFTGFAELTVGFYLWQGLAVVITFLVDHAATAYGTKRYGGSAAAIYGGIAGMLIGPFILGPLGFVTGAFAGAFIGELTAGKRLQAAFRAALGTLIGMVGGAVLKLAVGLGMIVGFFRAILR